MVKLIVADLDNTLLNDKKEITGYTAEILQKCRIKGIRVVFATARPERATVQFQQLFQPDYIISNNGATIADKYGNIIYNKSIPKDVKDLLISTLIFNEDVTCITVESGNCLYTNYRGAPWDSANWNTVYTDFSEKLNIDTPKISIECKNNELITELISKYTDLHLYFNSGENWSQVMHLESTKMNAIRHLTNLLGISTDNAVAFGDDFNDIEMIRHCGVGIAVGNAIEPVKQAAAFICKSNNENGVANWIETNLLLR